MSESVQEPWRTAVENARAQLSETSDIDRCAELLLESNGGDLRVQISLADGRATVRDLSDPSQLEATLRALLSVPSVDSTKGRSPPTVRVVQPVSDDLHNRATSPSQPHLELGIGAMARIAGAPLYGGLGLAAFAQLSLNHWLVGVSVHWDASDQLLVDAPPSGFNMQTLALGVQAGVRSSFRGFALDALIGPEARVENQEAFGGQAAADGIGGGTTDFRVDAALRLSAPSSGPLRFFSETDLNASPARVTKTHRLDDGLPTLPAWSAGIALGLLWSLS